MEQPPPFGSARSEIKVYEAWRYHAIEYTLAPLQVDQVWFIQAVRDLEKDTFAIGFELLCRKWTLLSYDLAGAVHAHSNRLKTDMLGTQRIYDSGLNKVAKAKQDAIIFSRNVLWTPKRDLMPLWLALSSMTIA